MSGRHLDSGLGGQGGQRLHSHEVATQTELRLGQAEREAHKLREIDSRHRHRPPLAGQLVVISVKVELAERADRRDDIRSSSERLLEQNVGEAESGVRQRSGQAPAAALGLQGVGDHLGSQRGEQPVHCGRVPCVIEGSVRAHDLAPIVGRNLQTGERPHHLLPDHVKTDVVDQNIERMANRNFAAVLKPRRLECMLHRRADLGRILEIVLRLVEHEVACAAGRHEVMNARLLGKC